MKHSERHSDLPHCTELEADGELDAELGPRRNGQMNHSRLRQCWRRSALLALVTIGCEQVEVTMVEVATVEVTPQTASVPVNGTAQLSAGVLSSSGVPLAGRSIAWSSLDPAVAEVNATGLVRGLAEGSARIQASAEGASGFATVSVTARPAAITVSPASLSFTVRQGEGNPPSRRIDITEADGAELSGLNVEVAYPSGQPAGWLTTSLGSASTPTALTVAVATGTLTAGTYTATVRILSAAASNSPQSVHVELVVQPAAPTIVLSRPEATFSALLGGGDPAATQIEVSNAGSGSVAGLAAAILYSAGQPGGWLTAQLAGTTAPTTLTLSASKASLGAGTYNATVQLTSTTAVNSPVDIAVTFVISNVAPGAPSNLQASAASTAQINLTWSAAAGSVERYRIERRTGSGSFVALDSVSGGTLTYQNSGLAAGTQYTYRAQACNTAGCSDFSNEASATTPQIAPGAPSGLQASAVSDSRIDLSWNAASGSVERYRIERRTGGGSFAAIDSVSGGTLAYQNTGLAAATEYTYRVQACNAAGCSAFSNEASATTQPALSVPAPPTDLTVSDVTALQVSLTWSHDGLLVDAFELQRASDGMNFVTIHSTESGAARSYADQEVAAETTYWYRVGACNTLGCSDPSNVVEVTTPGQGTPPAPPGNVALETVSSTALRLSWTAPGGQTHYNVRWRRTQGGGGWTEVQVAGDETVFTQGGLDPGRMYNFRIEACNASGCSAYVEVSETTTSGG